MLYRKLGKSNVKISAITLGVATYASRVWGQSDGMDLATAFLSEAIDRGFTTLDTASTYGFGLCDEVIGQAIKGKRDRVQIVAKYGQRWNSSEGTFICDSEDPRGNPMKIMRNSRPESIIEECEEILKRLKTDYIDLFVCHWPDTATPQAESMGAVSKLIEQGKVLAAGVSNFSLEQMKEAHTALPIALTQSPYSMVNREIENDILPWCVENDVSVQAYSPLQSGLLARKTTVLAEDDPRREDPYFKPENLCKVHIFLEEIEPIAFTYNATIPQLVLNWTINRPSVASAICGSSTIDQVTENLESTKFNLTQKDLQRINELLDKLELSI